MNRVVFPSPMGFQNRSFLLFLVCIIFFLLHFSVPAYSQVYHEDEERFAFKVKQLDEFFERFNDQQTLLKEYMARTYNMKEVRREDLIKSLFNLRSGGIDKGKALSFINFVNNPQKPVYLSFYDDDWFARVKCSVIYEEKQQELFLILRVQKEENGASKWVIQSVYADFFNTPNVADPNVSLNPISHGTDFLGLSNAFEDPKNLQSYLPTNYEEDHLSKFTMELQNGRISFQQVEEISYHFFQVDGWILTVENFRRADQNSGWLISKLIEANAKEKKDYKQHILNLRI